MYELSQEETPLQEDARLQHALVYFFQNKAPNRIIERTLLEQFTDRNLSFDERYINNITRVTQSPFTLDQILSYYHESINKTLLQSRMKLALLNKVVHKTEQSKKTSEAECVDVGDVSV